MIKVALFSLAAVYLANNDRDAVLKQYSRLKTLNAELADKLYQALFSDKLVVANVK